MIFLKKNVAAVSARMFTWEVTTAFDGNLSSVELQKRFDEDFALEPSANHVSFWPAVSFNASDGRKHRYFVAVANEPLLSYRKKSIVACPNKLPCMRLQIKSCEASMQISQALSMWKIAGKTLKLYPVMMEICCVPLCGIIFYLYSFL